MKTRSPSKAAPAGSVTTSTASPAPKSVVQRPSRKKSLANSNSNGNGHRASSEDTQVITSLDEHASVTASPQDDQIAARAYQIWQQNGCQDGCDEDNWHQARRELSSTAPVG